VLVSWVELGLALQKKEFSLGLGENFLAPREIGNVPSLRISEHREDNDLEMILVKALPEMVRVTKRCESSDLRSNLIDVGKNHRFGVDCRYKSGRYRSGLISSSDSFNFLLP